MAKVTASAPGKCILFGEHAVVYGQPAVAVAIEQRISVSIESLASDADTWRIDGMHFHPEKHPHVFETHFYKNRRFWPPDNISSLF